MGHRHHGQHEAKGKESRKNFSQRDAITGWTPKAEIIVHAPVVNSQSRGVLTLSLTNLLLTLMVIS